MATNNPNNLSRLFQTAGTAKQQQGTGYTNLNRLFEANKQNQLGEKVAGDIGTQIGGVQTQLAEQKKQFDQEAEKNKVGGQKDVEQRDAVLGRFTSPSGAGGDLANEEITAFERFRGGQYGGPEGLKDTSALRQTAQQLQGQVSNFSPSGTQELLRRSVGTNKYTQGQSRLDSLLLDRSKLTPVARQAQGLGQEIQRADLAASGQAELNKNLAQQFAKETQEKLNAGLGGIDKAIQEQLTPAQQLEQDRLARIQAVQDFAAGKTAKKDAQGNVIKDQYGNVVYDTVNTRGTTNQYAQGNNLKELLKQKGLQQSELDQLFGSGDATQVQSQLESAAAQRSSLQNQINALQSRYDSAPYDYASESFVRSAQKTLQNQMNALRAQMGSIQGPDYSNLGIYGNALQAGKQEDFIQNIARSLANSQQAQGLTEAGVASAQQRASYEALSKLLGKAPSETKYRVDDPTKYEQGKFLIDPEQIKRSF